MVDGIHVTGLNAWFGSAHVLRGIDLTMAPKAVTAIIGPSGCGKSTLVRCLNRMHEVVPGATVSGEVLLDGEDIYAPEIDAVDVRRRIGMVFQKASPFPTMSVEENVAAGLKLNGVALSRADRDRIVEKSLKQAALWDEVRDRLNRP